MVKMIQIGLTWFRQIHKYKEEGIKVERKVQFSKNKSEQASSIMSKKKKKICSISTFQEAFLPLILLRFVKLERKSTLNDAA